MSGDAHGWALLREVGVTQLGTRETWQPEIAPGRLSEGAL
jgi:hypothetical protein